MTAFERFMRKRSNAFTLIELMMVVAIIGLLAATAIPTFGRYVKRSKTSEAFGNIPRMFQGTMAYYEQDHSTRDGLVPSLKLPVSAPMVPSTIPAGVKVATSATAWDNASWEAINFSISTPILYAYQYCMTADPTGTCNGGDPPAGSRFEVRAQGDLDGDGAFTSLFSRVGMAGTGTDISGGAGIYVDNELY
jgi:prepilin-type N-terminal cleavage/methylation domain-containing protein